MRKKNILFIVPSLTLTNGISKFLFNYITNMDISNFNISILSSNLRPASEYLDYFKSNNIKVFLIDKLSKVGFLKWYSEVKKFFKDNHNYDIIYSNVANQSYFFFKIARKYNIKKLCLHAHATKGSDNWLKNMINRVLIYKVKKMTTNRFSCSFLAGKYVFGSKKFEIIPNAIEYEKYKFNEEFRNEIRNKYNINGKKIIGFIGRFTAQKNIYFFKKIAKTINDNYIIIMIGEGDLKKGFIKKIKEENLENKFLFIDENSDVNKFYSAFDYFFLPSFFEGLPVVGVEAQINGLKCLFSDLITNELKISENVLFLKNDNPSIWISELTTYDRKSNVLSDSFNIKTQASKFERILHNL